MIVLLDTHTVAWAILNSTRLSKRAKDAIDKADVGLVSPISIYEIGQKVHLGKWQQMEPVLPRLTTLISADSSRTAAVTPELCLRAATLDWPHRDPFDRILAATALHHGAAIISADTVFDTLPGLRRVW